LQELLAGSIVKLEFADVGKDSCFKNFYHLGKEVDDSNLKLIKILEKKETNHYVDNILIYFELMEYIYFMEFVQANVFPHIPNSFNEFLFDKVHFILMA
jgi:hypothetical protein